MINVVQRLQDAFPDRKFTIKTQVCVNDYEFYNSLEFLTFLDKLSEDMTDEEYMNTDFYIND